MKNQSRNGLIDSSITRRAVRRSPDAARPSRALRTRRGDGRRRRRWRERGGEVVAPRAGDQRAAGARPRQPTISRGLPRPAGRRSRSIPDTYTSPETYEVALLAAGAAVEAVERVMAGRHTARSRAGPAARPSRRARSRDGVLLLQQHRRRRRARPHARRRARRHRRLRRAPRQRHAAHLRGRSQRAVRLDPPVSVLSGHRRRRRNRRRRGRGFTVNLPLEAGAVDEDYRMVFDEVVLPVLRQFEPDLVLVSAGFDAHERDPLGGMRLTHRAFAAMTMELRRAAESTAAGG